jgi:hypothetical protein
MSPENINQNSNQELPPPPRYLKKWQYTVMGGLLAIPLSLVIIPLAFFLTRFLGAGEDVVWFLAPEFFAVFMGLGMRGSPASSNEVVSTIIFVSIIFLVRTFIMGAIVGAVYGIFARKGKRKLFVGGLIIVFFLVIVLISYRTQDTYKANSVGSARECASILKKGIDGFDENRCYQELAEKTKDVSICDNITRPSSIEKSPNDYKWFCYEEVAHAQNDPAICDLIPEVTLNERNGNTQRKDRCYQWFNLCEKIQSISNRDGCYTNKAEFTKDIQSCELVSEKMRDYCYSRMAFHNKNAAYCEYIQNAERKMSCINSIPKTYRTTVDPDSE